MQPAARHTRIALDFDGTIADTNALKAQLLRERFGIEMPAYRCDRTSCVPLIGVDAYNEISSYAYGVEGTRSVPPIEGAREFIRSVAVETSIYVVTARNEVTFPHAVEWLEREGLRSLCTKVVSMAGRPKHTIATEFGCTALVDDDARHLVALDSLDFTLVEFKHGADPDVTAAPGAILCRTWQEVRDVLGA